MYNIFRLGVLIAESLYELKRDISALKGNDRHENCLLSLMTQKKGG